MSGHGKKILPKNGSCPEYNIALIGALGVGKSALTVKYITKRFIMEYDPDMEGTFTKHEEIDTQELVVHIMDTCDKEDSDPLRYLKWADAFMVVYSITNRLSFEKAREYLESVTQYLKENSKDTPMALVGNKIDLERYRQISKAEGTSTAAEFDCVFYETSAAEEFEYVEDVFHGTITEIQREKGDRHFHFQTLYISEDKYGQRGGRPKSPRVVQDKKEKDDRSQTKKNSFRLFNKSFKIFN